MMHIEPCHETPRSDNQSIKTPLERFHQTHELAGEDDDRDSLSQTVMHHEENHYDSLTKLQASYDQSVMCGTQGAKNLSTIHQNQINLMSQASLGKTVKVRKGEMKKETRSFNNSIRTMIDKRPRLGKMLVYSIRSSFNTGENSETDTENLVSSKFVGKDLKKEPRDFIWRLIKGLSHDSFRTNVLAWLDIKSLLSFTQLSIGCREVLNPDDENTAQLQSFFRARFCYINDPNRVEVFSRALHSLKSIAVCLKLL